MKSRHAFTLVELLITLTIFSTVAILCANALVHAMASARKIQAQATLYSEAHNLMDQLAREVERGTVDYESYYLRTVKEETGWETQNYGFYAQTFFNPGEGDRAALSDPYSDIDGYGTLCSGGGYYPEDCPSETPTYEYLDLDTGAHPFTDISSINSAYDGDPRTMNAFCESADGAVECDQFTQGVRDELILVNAAGDLRTIFRREPFSVGSPDYHLLTLELSGSDTDNDGLVDTWVCTEKFASCAGGVPTLADFVPITPDLLTIDSFYVYITPMEDPYRAFAEEDIQIQPTVTVVLTATLSQDYSGRLLGTVPSLTLQRTLSTGVYSEVVSY